MNTEILYGALALILLAVLVGGVGPLYSRWLEKSLFLGLSFSAGIMLGAAFLHLIPEGFELAGSAAGLWILLGFLFLYVLEKFVIIHACHDLEDDCEVHQLGFPAFIGLSLHALTDGIALGAGFILPRLGWVIALSILLHKLPSAFALTTMLLSAQYSRVKILVLQGVFFMMVPLGVLFVYWGAGIFLQKQMGLLIAFSAGTFLHVAYSDILPELHSRRYQRYRFLIIFLLGILFMYGSSKFFD
ncbi:MAG: hypothetical protein A3I75_07485 [Deltaproteobacteria bacterium RIFCSPLOWO2_02_FULL_50_16]|nr:MAG: hypothetical protein A2053_03495 [Deltaproteobacteria bacterium GWA2_50_8]OGQ28544.1 MAG: hypothetical protein A3B79_01860 [Deltaproteobacteria bacterium RIFCSPHIGHO2_02_FULL_50_15]OGQ57146.1 MAG: hypothetical protein A3I75_07485 [Deltaproteobacteria bacterium RIFCSPLOWO2_02_FULL_50_16]OGQ68646.1 MAG: hypothetical protein A3F89_00985 [Deltaproteobacteria bacterium RIFCSPLOWO2_12_FULL_50_11]